MLTYNRITSISRAVRAPRNIRTANPAFSSVDQIRLFTADAVCLPTTNTIFRQFDDRADLHRLNIDTLRKDIESFRSQDHKKKIDAQVKIQTNSHMSRPSFFQAKIPIPISDNAHFYWHRVPQWKDVSEEQFLSYEWTLANTVRNKLNLLAFLNATLPALLTPSSDPLLQHIKTRDDFIQNAIGGLKMAPMAIRLTPHVLSVIDWTSPLDDPVRRQFLPLTSSFVADHPSLTLDSLHEEADSPIPGLVHRYPDKALFLETSICPVYCRYCTRSYAIGSNTEAVSKTPQKPSRRRWSVIYEHIEKTLALEDIVVSGGDTYYLTPENIEEIGERLLSMKHIQRIRFATKGLAVAPGRTLDLYDGWTGAIINLSNKARNMGKYVCIHTHFNHPNEITWVTEKAAKFLFKNNVIVRNQSVLLKGVNDSVKTMGKLIRKLADMNYQPYYVYQGDLVKGVEDLRTPLSDILSIEQQLRGTIAGFMMPSFVVDLPGGGGKRLAASFDTYDRETGISTFKAPGMPGGKGHKVYKYYDPLRTDKTSGTGIGTYEHRHASLQAGRQ